MSNTKTPRNVRTMSNTKTSRNVTWQQKLENQADLLEAQANTARLMAMAETDLDGVAVAPASTRAACAPLASSVREAWSGDPR